MSAGAERADERLAADAVPARPKSSGSFSSAAAPMIGVASRNANRAASLFERPTSRPPPIVAPGAREAGDQRERLRRADEERLRASPPAARSARRRPRRRPAARGGAAARRRRAAPRSAIRKIAADVRPTRTRFGACARAAGRGCPPGSCRRRAASRASRRSSSGAIPRSRSERPSPFTIRTQSRQKKPEQDERGRQVGRDEERDEVAVVLVDVPAEQLRQDHAVAEARDGKQLGDALQEPEHDRPRDTRSALRRGSRSGCAERFGPAAEPGEDEQAQPDAERRDAVLHVVVARIPPGGRGRSPGSDFAGSAK